MSAGSSFTRSPGRAGTDPTNALSALRLLTPEIIGPDAVLTWESVPSRYYFVELSTNLAFNAIVVSVARNLHGQEGSTTTSYTDPNAAATGFRHFYRVGVE